MSSDLMVPVNKFYQVYNDSDTSLWNEAMSESYVCNINQMEVPNRDTGKGFIEALLVAFPNINYTVQDTVIQGNKVTSRWTAAATHTGDLFGMPPTNKDVKMLGITIFRIEDGQIAELWDVWDEKGLMDQLTA